MRKIGIITSHHYPNYGNKLQNYALQFILNQLGFSAETISDTRSWPNMWSWLSNWKVFVHLMLRYKVTSFHYKMLKFIKFSREKITKSRYVINKHTDLSILADKYDYFVVGSDQIWNPEWPIFSNSFAFATFAKKNQKIAYAPSIGVYNIPEKRVEEYQIWLRNWKALSCREYEGAKIIEELTGENCPVVLDPTLLLPSTEWDNLIKARSIDEPYILFYSIWKLDTTQLQYLRERAYSKKCRFVDVSKHGLFDGKLDPFDFVTLIKFADEVYTDSFHGACFSLLYHRPMIIIRPTNCGLDKMSRLQTLFTHAEIETHQFPSVLNEFTNINWKTVDKNIENKRVFSKEYLKTSLQ